MHIELGWVFIATFSAVQVVGLVIVYGLLRWHLEDAMREKLVEQAKNAEQKFASKESVSGMREDVQKILGLFERLDAKLDQFLAMKPRS